jgi:hypothetical protein
MHGRISWHLGPKFLDWRKLNKPDVIVAYIAEWKDFCFYRLQEVRRMSSEIASGQLFVLKLVAGFPRDAPKISTISPVELMTCGADCSPCGDQNAYS